MLGLSKAHFVGNVVKDAELMKGKTGMSFSSFTLAVNKKTKNGPKVIYIDFKMFGATADNLTKYIKKGKPLYADGELDIEEYGAKDGASRRSVVIIANTVLFLGSGEDGDRPLTQHEVLDAVNDVVPEDKPVDLSEIPF